MTIIYINTGTYHAEVALEGLPDLPVNNIRKFLKLAFMDPESNREALHTITDWLPAAVYTAKNTWGYVVALYKDEYRAIPKGYRSVGATQQRRKNRALADSVKSARISYNRLVKMQAIFDKIKEKKNYA